MNAAPGLTVEQLSDAVVAVASTTRWPDGSLLLELDDQVLRELLAPAVHAALPASTTT